MPGQSPAAEASAHLTGPVYAVALLFVVSPVVDVLSQVWPLGLDSPSWRYGAIGLGANYLISALFGMLGLVLVAALRQHRRTLNGLSLLSALGALLLLVGALSFLLDAAQVRAGVPRDNPRTLWVFDVGAAKAIFKYLAGAGLLAWLALMGRKAGRSIAKLDAHAEEDVPRLVSTQQL
jgi:hypothetical protein